MKKYTVIINKENVKEYRLIVRAESMLAAKIQAMLSENCKGYEVTVLSPKTIK